MNYQIETPSSTLDHSNFTFSYPKKPKVEKESCMWSTLRIGRLSDWTRDGSFIC